MFAAQLRSPIAYHGARALAAPLLPALAHNAAFSRLAVPEVASGRARNSGGEQVTA